MHRTDMQLQVQTFSQNMQYFRSQLTQQQQEFEAKQAKYFKELELRFEALEEILKTGMTVQQQEELKKQASIRVV